MAGWARRGGEDVKPASGSRLVPVNLDQPHFRAARWWLLAEGVLLLALGVAGLTIGQLPPKGVALAADWALALTPIHCWLLIGAGILAALATLGRRTTLAAATCGAIAGLMLFAIGTASLGAPAGGHSTLRLWRYQVGDSVLFSVLTAYNFALSLWLVANALEGPAWIKRGNGGESGHDDPD
jgi:hypothetical protein